MTPSLPRKAWPPQGAQGAGEMGGRPGAQDPNSSLSQVPCSRPGAFWCLESEVPRKQETGLQAEMPALRMTKGQKTAGPVTVRCSRELLRAEGSLAASRGKVVDGITKEMHISSFICFSDLTVPSTPFY